jgi:hypothetical protein
MPSCLPGITALIARYARADRFVFTEGLSPAPSLCLDRLNSIDFTLVPRFIFVGSKTADCILGTVLKQTYLYWQLQIDARLRNFMWQ